MDFRLKEEFLTKWQRYFGDQELPITFYYSSSRQEIPLFEPGGNWSCLICELAKVRKGESMVYHSENVRCGGARRYLGYSKEMRPDFEYFLSYGIPEKMEGERYIKDPEMVKKFMADMRTIPAGNKYLIFKRWDKLEEYDEPVAAIFFAKPDVMSGLFTLCNFDQEDGMGVIAPFSSGCGSIVNRPYFEQERDDPRAVLGLFDVSARTCVPKDALTISIPMKKLTRMIGYMDESFLITESWDKVKKRLS